MPSIAKSRHQLRVAKQVRSSPSVELSPNSRRAVSRSGWTVIDKDADREVDLARNFMIAFVDGERAMELSSNYSGD